MIFLLIIIDILINNYTNFSSYFFLIYLYNKPYKYYLIVALIFDLIIFNTWFFHLIIFSLMYFINKLFKDLNKKNFYNFMFISLFNYILYIFLVNLLSFNSLSHPLIILGYNLLINCLFYIFSFRIVKDYN